MRACCVIVTLLYILPMFSHFILTSTLQGIIHFTKEETSLEKLTTFAKITQLVGNQLRMWNFKPSILSFSTGRSQLSGIFSSYWSQIPDLYIPALLFFFLLFDGESVLLVITWILGSMTFLGPCCMDYILSAPASPTGLFPLDPAQQHSTL